MPGLKVLITTWTLEGRHGTALYVRDLALGLLRAGHQPIVYSPELGEIAAELQDGTVPVVDDLTNLGDAPDVIHGNSHFDTMTALLQFPGVAAVFTCHAWNSWLAEPPHFPRLRRCIAVDHTCRDWLIGQRRIPGAQVRVVFNAVDTHRFVARGPLPSRPARAAVFSNYATENSYLGVVREACARLGLSLDAIGSGVGNVSARPESILGQYDLVFAKARCALEALAVGASVMLCDKMGMGPLVSTRNYDRFRQLNFGRRALQEPHRPEWIVDQVSRYDPADALEVSRRIRAEGTLDHAVERLVTLYREVMDEQANGVGVDSRQESLAAARYLHSLNRFAGLKAVHNDLTLLDWELRRPHNELLRVRDELQSVRGRLDDVHRSVAVRLSKRLTNMPVLGRFLRLPVRKFFAR